MDIGLLRTFRKRLAPNGISGWAGANLNARPGSDDGGNAVPTGTVVSLHVADTAAAPTRALNEVRAVPGRGLEGDRYFASAGTYSDRPGPDREATLIEIESIEALERDYGVRFPPGDARRNIVTRGVSLNHLVGRTFRIGETLLRGIRLCEPCTHMARLAGKDVVLGLVHRGGLRAQILRGGVIRVGDRVEEIPPTEAGTEPTAPAITDARPPARH